MKRTLTTLAVAAALLAGACGGDDRQTYDDRIDAIRDGFMEEFNATGNLNPAFGECLFDALADNHSVDELLEAGLRGGGDDELPEAMNLTLELATAPGGSCDGIEIILDE